MWARYKPCKKEIDEINYNNIVYLVLSICNKYKKWDKQINGKIFYVHELDKTIVKISI